MHDFVFQLSIDKAAVMMNATSGKMLVLICVLIFIAVSLISGIITFKTRLKKIQKENEDSNNQNDLT